MGKNKKHTPDHNEEIVSYVEGSSTIDIGEIKRAQANQDADLSDDELTLDEEAKMIFDEMDHDPELKKDVLEGYTESESNLELDKIASRVEKQTKKQIKEFAKLADTVSDELTHLNLDMINEDKLLESTIAEELAHDMMAVETEEMSEEDAELKAALPQIDESGNYVQDELQSCISALLFYSEKSLSLKKMKEMLEMPEAEDEIMLQAIEGLKAEFAKSAHGFELAEIAGGYQLRTKIARAPLLRKLAKIQVQRLSRGAMETLTIVSYKQPCTKDDIDQVRGVDSSHFIRTLLDRKLIDVTGRSEAAGRPMIYETTDTFLEVFGMMDLKSLPPLHEIEAMVPQLAAQAEGEEDPRIIQMRKMVVQMKTDSNHLDYNAKEDDQILQDIRDRVKTIDITTPYLARQKALADEGIHGEEAEEMLAKEFGFSNNPAVIEAPAQQSELALSEPLNDTALTQAREALEKMDIDFAEDELNS